MIFWLPTHLLWSYQKERELINVIFLVQRVFYITRRGSTSMVNFELQSQTLGASYLLHLNSVTDSIGVDGLPPADVGLLEEGNSKLLRKLHTVVFHNQY
jgi:hypothetical protein